MEYAGAVEVEPPLHGGELEWATRAGWPPSRAGDLIRPRPDAPLDRVVRGLRELVAATRAGRLDGVVAAYDAQTREFVTVSVRGGSVTRRTQRAARQRAPSNLVDLASRRREVSRAISTPIA